MNAARYIGVDCHLGHGGERYRVGGGCCRCTMDRARQHRAQRVKTPRQPNFSPEEDALATQLRASGMSWKTVAAALAKAGFKRRSDRTLMIRGVLLRKRSPTGAGEMGRLDPPMSDVSSSQTCRGSGSSAPAFLEAGE